MARVPTFRLTLTATAVAALLAACGGGGDSADSDPVTTTELTTKVLDGPIRNALVCYDLNDNASCDTGEPSTRSAADGTATLTIEKADLGLHGFVAMVGTDAVDADHGAVTQAFVLQAPADRSAAITPLSTLVARMAAAEAITSADAESALRDQGRVTHALTGDFSAFPAASRAEAAALSRAVLLAIQAAQTALAPAVGQPDGQGAPMAKAKVDDAAIGAVAGMLDALADAARVSAADTTSTATARDAALQVAVEQAMAANFQLTPANVASAIEASKPAETTAHQATGGSSLAWLSFADAGNWSFREFRSTLAQDTPDSNGLVRYTDHRRMANGGTAVDWGASPGYTRSDVYWTGTRWFACPTDHVNTQTLPNAAGVRSSTYCDAYTSTNTRRTVDIAGKTMASVVAGIRAFALPSTGGTWSAWGPDPASGILSGAVFPAGSSLRYQTTVQTSNPDAYNPAVASNAVNTFGPAAAAASSAVCPSTSLPQVPTTTLEQLVADSPGTPCLYTPNATTGPRSEWWGGTTVSLNGGVPGTASLPYYSASRSIRASFADGRTVQYWSCARRASDNSPRNCDRLGTGTYAIETRGDGRVLTLSNQPVEAAPAGFYRVFVEREGKVWFGFRTRLSTDNTVRLNGPATDALFAQIGVTR